MTDIKQSEVKRFANILIETLANKGLSTNQIVEILELTKDLILELPVIH